MLRRIAGFERDDVGGWVALLECHHRQHIRHRPPFWVASWIDNDTERAEHIGATMQCPLCDRCDLPAGPRLLAILCLHVGSVVRSAALEEHLSLSAGALRTSISLGDCGGA